MAHRTQYYRLVGTPRPKPSQLPEHFLSRTKFEGIYECHFCFRVHGTTECALFEKLKATQTDEQFDAIMLIASALRAHEQQPPAQEHQSKVRPRTTQMPRDVGRHLYVIRNPITNHIKIGHTRNIQQRFRALQNGNSVELELVQVFRGCGHLETELHMHFSEHRQMGEWFAVSVGEALLAIDRITQS